ncbi:aminotransferase class IV [Caminibacter pacificus]
MDLIETMLVTNRNIQNFELHIDRVKRSCEYLKWKFDIQEWKSIKDKFPYNESIRLRVTYNQKGIRDLELFKIQKREFKTFKVVEIDFDYFLKKKKRKNFETLKKRYPKFDEFILIKNGLVTDTTISNLAFFTGNEWITPKFPLLKGTKREELLKKGLLKEENIKKSDLKYFKKIAMINAILGFFEIDEYDIIK